MHHQVSAEIQWVLKIWRSKRVVYADKDVVLFSNGGNCGKITDIHQRVGRSFCPYQLCVRGDLFFYVLYIMHIDIKKFYTEFFKHFREQAIRPAIHIITCNYFISRLK